MEIFMLEARGGQLAFLFMLYVFIILINKGHIVRGFFISSLIVVLLFLAGYNLSYTFKSRVKLAVNSIALLKEKKDFNTSSGSRIGLWIVAKDMIFEKPLFGTGVGGYRNNFKKVFNEKHSYMGNEVFKVGYSMLHNEFLQIFVQFGLIGFILYLNIFYRFLKVALKNDNGFVAILFLSYYFVFVLTYVALERYQLLYTFVIMMPLLAYGSLCGKVN
jgi:O-antigen ligase